MIDPDDPEFSARVLAYIESHPNASPQEVLAHFGVPFVRSLYETVLEENSAGVRHLRESPNPNDRAWTEKPS